MFTANEINGCVAFAGTSFPITREQLDFDWKNLKGALENIKEKDI